MSNDLYTSTYNPDVLSCIANLSNDEVFTPPEVANAMLDLLPQELFRRTPISFQRYLFFRFFLVHRVFMDFLLHSL